MDRATVERPAAVIVDDVDVTGEDSEAELIRRFTRERQIPTWVEQEYQDIQDNRKYVSEDAFAHDDPDVVAVNLILRNIYAKLSQVFPEDPAVRITPQRPINMQLAQQMDQQFHQQVLMEHKRNKAIAETGEALVQKLLDESSFAEFLQDAALDAITDGVMWLKCTWVEDQNRDALGVHVFDDAQDQVARLKRLSEEWHTGEWDDSDSRYFELMQLSEYMVDRAQQAVAAGDPRDARLRMIADADPGQPVKPYLVPEPERWQGVAITPVRAENISLDWGRVDRISAWHTGRHITERTWMHVDEIAETYGLSEDEKRSLGRRIDRRQDESQTAIGGDEDDDPNDVDLDETSRHRDYIAVYERWDRDNHRMYIWAEGLDRFLHTEIPEVKPSRFFPYEPIFYNPMTGRLLPKSDVAIAKKMQDEINQRLTSFKEALEASYDKYVAPSGSMDDEDIESIEGCEPHKIAFVRKELYDEMKSGQFLQTISGKKVNPSDYDIGGLMRLLEMQMGLPMQATGATGNAKLATEVQVANDHMLAQSGRHGVMLMNAARNIMQMTFDYAATAMSTQTVGRLVGPTAVWPTMDREQIMRGMSVEVRAASNDAAAKRQEVEQWTAAAQTLSALADVTMKMQQIGMQFDITMLAEQILSGLDVRVPIDEMLQPIAATGVDTAPLMAALMGGGVQPDQGNPQAPTDPTAPPNPGPGVMPMQTAG